MAIEDKIKWDKKYQENPRLLRERKASKKVEDFALEANRGEALEIACGTGRNSLFLAEYGFKIDALDISTVALEHLDAKGIDNITTKETDLVGFIPKQESYDLIIKTNYLDRELIPHLFGALKEDGILILETYMDHPSNAKPPSNPDFLLKEGELKTFFNEELCEIIEFDQFDNEADEKYRMKKQSIVVRRLPL